MSFWKGKRIWVDLTRGETTSETLSESYARKWGGMRGLALPVMLEKINRDTDPLGPENVMIVASGLLNGLGFPGVCKEPSYRRVRRE